jgi:hypothetical protein
LRGNLLKNAHLEDWEGDRGAVLRWV